MISIKNSDAKKVCQVDPQSRTVEIVHKSCRTTIRFLENGTYCDSAEAGLDKLAGPDLVSTESFHLVINATRNCLPL